MSEKCKQCNGTGWVVVPRGRTLMQGTYTCGICRGTGIQPKETQSSEQK